MPDWISRTSIVGTVPKLLHTTKHKYIHTSSHRQSNLLHVWFPPETQFSLSLIVHLLNDIRVIKTVICTAHAVGKLSYVYSLSSKPLPGVKRKWKLLWKWHFLRQASLQTRLRSGWHTSFYSSIWYACFVPRVSRFGLYFSYLSLWIKNHIYSILSKTVCETVCNHKHLVCKE